MLSSKTRRRAYLFGENDIVTASSMAESHYREWLADGLEPTDTTRELLGHRSRVVRKHVYRSPSGAARHFWVAEESHQIT